MALYTTTATLDYSIVDAGYRLVANVEQDLADYYRKLVPRYKDIQRQKYGAHISVVRKEIPLNLEFWGKYQGEEIEFTYDSEVKWGKVYYWLNCFSKRLEEIRTELGLPVSSEYTRPPDSWIKCFHCTIGNCKKWII